MKLFADDSIGSGNSQKNQNLQNDLLFLEKYFDLNKLTLIIK